MSVKYFSPIVPHSSEQALILNGQGNINARCGRRFGKSCAGVWKIVKTLMQRGGDAVYVAPSYGSASMRAARQQINEIHALLWGLAGEDVETKLSKSERVWQFPGGTITLRSADVPDSLRGGSYVYAVLDEFAFWKDGVSILREVIQPALLDRNGKILIVSTPRHASHESSVFYEDCKALETWTTIHAPTWVNPYLSAEALEEIRSTTPSFVWQQEYAAECGEGAGYLFGELLVDDGVRLEAAPSRGRGTEFIIGCDWATSQGVDSTVFAVYDKVEKAIVHVMKPEGGLTEQLEELSELWERFNCCRVVAETNGIGRPAVDRAHELGLPIEEFTMTSASKQEIMFYLASQVEKGEIRFLDDPDLRKEFAHFRVTASPSGGYKLAAEGSMHDDQVVAVALAVGESRYRFSI